MFRYIRFWVVYLRHLFLFALSSWGVRISQSRVHHLIAITLCWCCLLFQAANKVLEYIFTDTTKYNAQHTSEINRWFSTVRVLVLVRDSALISCSSVLIRRISISRPVSPVSSLVRWSFASRIFMLQFSTTAFSFAFFNVLLICSKWVICKKFQLRHYELRFSWDTINLEKKFVESYVFVLLSVAVQQLLILSQELFFFMRKL